MKSGLIPKKATAKKVMPIRTRVDDCLLLFLKMLINEKTSNAGTTGITPEKNPFNIVEFLVLA